MRTYICKTRGPSGSKGGRGVCETWVVKAASDADAEYMALALAHPNSVVFALIEVFNAVRISIA